MKAITVGVMVGVLLLGALPSAMANSQVNDVWEGVMIKSAFPDNEAMQDYGRILIISGISEMVVSVIAIILPYLIDWIQRECPNLCPDIMSKC